ncbi:MAG: nucleotidyltransferase family protein [Sphingobacteriaceae bacterium]|nr:nucleotidyltransferase family protein [Sphingobacteriaceae bacterium]
MDAIQVHTKQALFDLLAANSTKIRAFGVERLGVFGSFCKETNTDKSDIDLLVDFSPESKNFDNFMELSFFLEDLLGRKTELVTTASLSPFIGPYILNEVEYVSL